MKRFPHAGRPEERAKVLGTARFAAEGPAPNPLTVRMLICPQEGPSLARLDVGPALEIPGVVAAMPAVENTHPWSYGFDLWPGRPLAAVAAESEAAAAAGVAAIAFETSRLPAREDFLLISSSEMSGDPDRAPEVSPQHVDVEYTCTFPPDEELEPAAALAWPTADGGVTLVVANGSLFRLRQGVAAALGLPAEKVRLIEAGHTSRRVGMRGDALALVAALAQRAGRPVRFVARSAERRAVSHHRGAARIRCRLGADSGGRLESARVEGLCGIGIESDVHPLLTHRAAVHGAGPYRYALGTSVAVTLAPSISPPAGALPGYGALEVIATIEGAIDELAERCRADPLAFRLSNIPQQPDDGKADLSACLERVRQASDWERRRGTIAGQAKRGSIRRGLGVACASLGLCLGAGAVDEATHLIRPGAGGRFTIISGFPGGGGAGALFCQMAALATGFPALRFEWAPADTEMASDCGPAYPSRATIVGGEATRLAARRLLGSVRAGAAQLLGCRVDELSQAGETFSSPAGRSVTLDGILAHADALETPLSASAGATAPADPKRPFAAWGACAIVAQAAVDVDSGSVRVERVWGVVDAGRLLDPAGATGRVIGAVGHALGLALYGPSDGREWSLALPRATEMPPVAVQFVETPLPGGPFGARAVTEPALLAATPAILNAISAAAGRRVRRLPAATEGLLLGADPDADCDPALKQLMTFSRRDKPPQGERLRLTVRYTGMLAGLAGSRVEMLDLPAGARLADAMEQVYSRHPDLRHAGTPGAGGVPLIRWMINGRTAPADSRLADGDELTLLAAAAGG